MPDPPEDQPVGPRPDEGGRRHVGSGWETLVDKQIREAVEEGRFDNLPHRGQPLPNDENPYAAEWGLAFHVLKNAGFAPPWIEADKEVRALLERRDALIARGAARPAPSMLARRQAHARIQSLVEQVNAAITRLNAEAPSYRQHRQPLTLAAEIRRYDEACDRGSPADSPG